MGWLRTRRFDRFVISSGLFLLMMTISSTARSAQNFEYKNVVQEALRVFLRQGDEVLTET